MTRSRLLPFAVMLGLSMAAPTALRAQGTVARPAQVEQSRVVVLPGGLDERRAEDIRQAFREVMQRYPPALGRILKIDPGLMANQGYMAAYPDLAEFIKIHPEVARYPSYFLSYVNEPGNYEPSDPDLRMKDQVISMWRNTMEGLTFFMVFLTVVLTITWLARFFVGHRRWIRATKIQSEMHSRLLERLSSNDELLAYVQSPAGSQFLQAAPIPAADVAAGQTLAAPFSRILWSVQAGLVLASAGIGLLFIKQYVMPEIAEFLLTMGVLGVSLGLGFVLAALVSYLISNHLGLFEARSKRSDSRSA